jgi:SpoVK/Ycf46/Vps4 family AAA+-type ATPase
MANGDLLRKLFRGYTKHDAVAFRSAAEAIIQEERAKNHRLLADDLEQILLNGVPANGDRGTNGSTYEVPRDRERSFPLLDIQAYDYSWERLVVSAKALSILQQIETEHRRAEVLAAYGLRPTKRAVFYGPPGCGKTLAAKVLASALGYPLVTVRFDAVVSSYLGETATNLRRVFDFIQRGQWVVLFDEFDAIGKDRDNPFEHGELKRVVNTLLQLMDAFTGESLLIAATNHEGLLDNAIWRRFDAVVPFTLPTEQDRVLLLRLFLRGFGHRELDLARLARRLKGATGSDIELVIIAAVRRAVLDNRNILTEADGDSALSLWRERFALSSSARQQVGDVETQDRDRPSRGGEGLT